MAVDDPDRIDRHHYREYLYDMLRELAAIAGRCGDDLTAQLLVVLVANADTMPVRLRRELEIPVCVDVSLEARRLAALLKIAANTARLIARAGPRNVDGKRVSRVAAGVDLLAVELEELTQPDLEPETQP